MTGTYKDFLARKKLKQERRGFEPSWLPDRLFDFQKHLVEWAVRLGRGALFEDCGLGKSFQALVWAENVVRHANRPVLIVAPLAVSRQFVAEGEKFGVAVRRTQDGTVRKGVNVTNYERLHNYDPAQLGGVVADECFPPDTLIDIPGGSVYIKDIRVGQQIVGAMGPDTVSDVHRREVPYAVKIEAAGRRIIASPNHPFFTQRGWVGAQDLRPGDYALETASAVRLVRGQFPTEVPGVIRSEVLRDILFSEVADDPAGSFGEGSQSESSCGTREVPVRQIQGRELSESGEEQGTDTQTQSHVGPRCEGEGLPHLESHEPQTFRSWWQRDGSDEGGEDSDGCVGTAVGSVLRVVGPCDSRLSVALQDRLRASREENRYRGGWKLAPLPEGTGQEEGRHVGFARVDGVEVLEQGHPDLERYRSPDGKFYFYDLGGTRHPSFSVQGLLVHNSSILKNFDGKTRRVVTDFLAGVPYCLLCTATPAPNDHMELGTSAEAVGAMTRSRMLGTFFTNGGESTQQWSLKGHARARFWEWVATWARAVRRPSDFGFDDGKFVLPPLEVTNHNVAGLASDGFLPEEAETLNEQRAERKRTLRQRCEKVAELAPVGRPYLAWCHLNAEGDLLEEMLPGAVQVSGSLKDEEKEERLWAFTRGEIKTLVTKPSIAGFGLNWQHCSDMSFFPSHSHEQFYQALRRCYRFGQERPVKCRLVASESEARVVSNMLRKERASQQLYDGIIRSMRAVLDGRSEGNGKVPAEVPEWLRK